MNASTIKEWFQQITTGHAFAVAAPTLAAYFGGAITGQQALTALFGAAVLAIWPEAKKTP